MSGDSYKARKKSPGLALFRYGICSVLIALLSGFLLAEDKQKEVSFDARTREWISITSLSGHSGIRSVCERLSRTYHLSIVIDRKLDPHRPVTLRVPVTGSIIEVLGRIAENQDAELRELGEALLILSGASAEKLKTLVALRTKELRTERNEKGKSFRYPPQTVQRIMNRHAWRWDELARPRELALEAAEKTGLKIENPDLVPHDLWHNGELPHAHFTEFLSFVLVQYDLTFVWEKGGSIRIIEAPRQVAIEQVYQIGKERLREYRRILSEKFPQSQWKQRNSRVIVTGPVELHDQLKLMQSRKTTAKTNNRVPWKKRRFTMRVVRKPLKEVLQFLDASGLPIQYDIKRIEAAGIAPDQLISFETEQADAEQLMRALCDPIKLPFSINDDQIQIGSQSR